MNHTSGSEFQLKELSYYTARNDIVLIKVFFLLTQVHFKVGKDRGKKILKKIKDMASGGKKKVGFFCFHANFFFFLIVV